MWFSIGIGSYFVGTGISIGIVSKLQNRNVQCTGFQSSATLCSAFLQNPKLMMKCSGFGLSALN